MIYLIGYIAVGVVVLAVVYISHRLSQSPESKFKDDLMSSIRPESEQLGDKIITYFVAPVLAVIFILLVWPSVIYLKGKEIFFKKVDQQPDEPKEFSVSKDDLIQQISLEEIEFQERVEDPLSAVPDLPFGHLNKAWTLFLEKRDQEDVIWSFSAHWTSEWGRKELRAGYVLVKPDLIGPYFLTTWKNVE